MTLNRPGYLTIPQTRKVVFIEDMIQTWTRPSFQTAGNVTSGLRLPAQ
jgi:hypothetical protein